MESLIEGNLGTLVVEIRVQINNLWEQFELSNQDIQKYYYDPFETNQVKVIKALQEIEKMTGNKIIELDELYYSVDQRKRMLTELAVDFVDV